MAHYQNTKLESYCQSNEGGCWYLVFSGWFSIVLLALANSVVEEVDEDGEENGEVSATIFSTGKSGLSPPKILW